MLKQEPTEIIDDPSRYLTLIHGEAGIGKTTFAASILGHYFARTEEGTAGLRAYGQSITSWPEFISLCKDLKEGVETGWKDQREIKMLVVDVYELLLTLCGDYICAKEKFVVGGKSEKYKKMEDVPFGLGYKRATYILLLTLEQLRRLGLGIMLLSHTRHRLFKWKGQEFPKAGPRLSQGSMDSIVASCDAVAYFAAEEEVKRAADGSVFSIEQGRYMIWAPGFQVIAKHRLKHFPEKTKVERLTGYQDYLKIFAKACAETKAELE